MALNTRGAESDDAGSSALPLVTRRAFLSSAGASAAGAMLPVQRAAAAAAPPLPGPDPARPVPAPAVPTAGPVPVTLLVNGTPHALVLEPRVTLLDALREVLGLTGTKKGCDRGQCGACTVLVEGRRINSCLTLAVMHDRQRITTIEGLATRDSLHPMQAAFIRHDAFQCGYCTPGQICSAVAALDELASSTASAATPDVGAKVIAITPAEIRERMSGNICRCGAYPNIVAAVLDVAGQTA